MLLTLEHSSFKDLNQHTTTEQFTTKQFACCRQHKNCIPGTVCMADVGMFPFPSQLLYELGVDLTA